MQATLTKNHFSQRGGQSSVELARGRGVHFLVFFGKLKPSKIYLLRGVARCLVDAIVIHQATTLFHSAEEQERERNTVCSGPGLVEGIVLPCRLFDRSGQGPGVVLNVGLRF